jgi:hypothetical protein
MKVTSAIEWLKQNGYKYERGSNPEWKTHYLHKRTESSNCQSNGRPPKMGFTINEHPLGNTMSVNIRAEAINGQWVDVGYYSMDIDMVKELSTLEFIVVKMWECAN